jgi:hypothetical protein
VSLHRYQRRRLITAWERSRGCDRLHPRYRTCCIACSAWWFLQEVLRLQASEKATSCSSVLASTNLVGSKINEVGANGTTTVSTLHPSAAAACAILMRRRAVYPPKAELDGSCCALCHVTKNCTHWVRSASNCVLATDFKEFKSSGDHRGGFVDGPPSCMPGWSAGSRHSEYLSSQ